MTLGLDEARAYLQADKWLQADEGWQAKKNRDDQYPILNFVSRVRIEQAMPRGLKFRVSVFPTFPNVATFQLECDLPAQRTCFALYRLEWRPISGHSNRMAAYVPEEIRGEFFEPGETHHHICTDHVGTQGIQVLKPGVHAARRIVPDFGSYADALAFVCAKIHIRNPDDIPPSNAQWELLI